MALGPTPDPAVALENMKRELKLLRTQRKHQRGINSRSITLARKSERLDVRIGELAFKIETLSKILKSRLIGTTSERKG